MFLPRETPPVVTEGGLRSLRLALNTPVLAAGELPAGPAMAAIALHEGVGDGLALVVMVRSLADGQGLCWGWRGSLEPVALEAALDAALSFGESMGFLFDDDAFASDDSELRRRALDGWWAVAGWPAAVGGTAPAEGPDSEHRVAEVGEGRGQRLPLTKFRRRLADIPAQESVGNAPPQAARLGRLRLVRRWQAPEGAERPPLWLRLLGSF